MPNAEILEKNKSKKKLTLIINNLSWKKFRISLWKWKTLKNKEYGAWIWDIEVKKL